MAITKHNFKSGGVILASDFNQLENDIDNSLKNYLPLSGGIGNGTFTFIGNLVRKTNNFNRVDWTTSNAFQDSIRYVDKNDASLSRLYHEFLAGGANITNLLVYLPKSNTNTYVAFRVGYDNNGNKICQFDNKEVERINASSYDYIRYENGLQICWSGVQNTNNVSDGITTATFSQPFSTAPIMSLVAVQDTVTPIHFQIKSKNATEFTFVTFTNNVLSRNGVWVGYIAIGKWK